MRWRYNAKLKRWYHPTSAVSDNGPDDPPAELEGNGPPPPARRERIEAPRPTAETLPCALRQAATGAEVDCGCGGRGVKLPVYGCAIHELCTVPSPGRRVKLYSIAVATCLGCPDRRG
jgi:hypothetical protein